MVRHPRRIAPAIALTVALAAAPASARTGAAPAHDPRPRSQVLAGVSSSSPSAETRGDAPARPAAALLGVSSGSAGHGDRISQDTNVDPNPKGNGADGSAQQLELIRTVPT